MNTQEIKWYTELPINTKIFLKENCEKITGLSFKSLIKLLDLKYVIQLFYIKLVQEYKLV